MRISQQQIVNGSLDRLRKRLEQYADVQTKLSTGKALQRPSEDPGTMNSILSLKGSQRVREQEARNASEGQTWINLGDSKLQNANNAMKRAHDLLVRAASPMTSSEKDAIATELEGIREEIVALANARHQGQGLFAGFSANDAVGQVAGVWTYTGDSGLMKRRIGEGETVQVQIGGDQVFGFSAGAGQDVFSVLDRAANAVRTGTAADVNASMGEVETSSNRVLDGLARLGAVGARIERVLLRNGEEQITLKGELSEMQDVDLAEMVMELQLQEVAYQATLGALSKAVQPSLLDFLR